MLPKSKRLKAADFKRFRGARAYHAPHFMLRAISADTFKAAAVVSAAVAKQAVKRNLLRRRVYAILKRETHLPRVLTLTAKKGAAELSFIELQKELESLLRQIGKMG